MTLGPSAGATAFSDTADAYADTMAPSVARMAARVVERARLRPGDRVLDAGTGTGTAAALARGDGRRVVGLDAAPGMLAIARREVPDVELVEASFDAVPFGDGSFDVVIAVHALLFADDPGAALREWRRLVAPGGRVSLSVPGPKEVMPAIHFDPVFDRHGIDMIRPVPDPPMLAGWAEGAGWRAVDVATDPTTTIDLPDEAAFRRWLTVGGRGRATADWDEARREALVQDLLAVSPRDERGFHLPFGTIYLAAVAS